MTGHRTADQASAVGPAWWLPGAHLQTVWVRLARSRPLIQFSREVLTTPDDDDLMLDHTEGPPGSPRVLLLHGLEGSAHSLHTQGLAAVVARAGWRATVLNFRSCARDPSNIKCRLSNRRPRLYHSGETTDLDFVVRTLVAREPASPLYAIGFSLGGNVLLKWLGEAGSTSAIRAAATLSVPYDLAAASRYLERRIGRIYTSHFLRRLKLKAADMIARFPRETSHIDAARVRAAQTFFEFDDALTAPLHGFAGAATYYAESSAVGFLPRVAVPTYCLTAVDDPFFPPDAAAHASTVAASNPQLRFELTKWGGHTGFVSGPWPWRPLYWAEEATVAWLRQRG